MEEIIIYDSDNRVFQKVNNAGQITEYLYDDLNRPELVKSANELSVRYKYDGFGKLVETILPTGAVVKNKHDWAVKEGDDLTIENISTLYCISNYGEGLVDLLLLLSEKS